MSEEIMNNEELLEDEDYIITLVSEDGEEVDFVEIAGIEHEESFYVIVQPVEPVEGIGEDEALVFLVEEGEDGEDKFTIETDDAILDAVFARYNELIEQDAE